MEQPDSSPGSETTRGAMSSRDYKLVVPSDCTASNTLKENRDALKLMRDYLKADVRPSAKIRLRRS